MQALTVTQKLEQFKMSAQRIPSSKQFKLITLTGKNFEQLCSTVNGQYRARNKTWTQTSSICFNVHRQWYRNPFTIFPKSCTSFPTHSLQKHLPNATSQWCCTGKCVLAHIKLSISLSATTSSQHAKTDAEQCLQICNIIHDNTTNKQHFYT